jgi:hypothetical protein
MPLRALATELTRLRAAYNEPRGFADPEAEDDPIARRIAELIDAINDRMQPRRRASAIASCGSSCCGRRHSLTPMTATPRLAG